MNAPPPASAPVGLESCAFEVGGHCFAIPSSCVAEVLHARNVTPVPLATEAVAGLIHLRGRIVPVIDMRRRLGLDATFTADGGLIVVRLQDDWYALLVDKVLDVGLIPTDRVEPPSGSPSEPAADARTGVFAAEDRLVHLLDPQRIVNALLRPRTSPTTRTPTTKQGAAHVGTNR